MRHARYVPLILATMALAGCEGTPGGAAAFPRDSLEIVRARLAQVEAVSAEKDSLVRELSEATSLIVSVGTEIASVQTPGDAVGPRLAGTEGTTADDRVALLGQVRDLTTRVRRSEARLSATRRRLDALISRSDSLSFSLGAYQQSLADLTAIVSSQKETVLALQVRVDSLQSENIRLAEANLQLADTLTEMGRRERTAHFVVGSKKELIERGIIVEEGGTRFLIFTRTGETLRPAESLDPADFTTIDLALITAIPLPRPDRRYRIVSRHDLAHVDPTSVSDGKIRGTLRILDPPAFWAVSRFLILVED